MARLVHTIVEIATDKGETLPRFLRALDVLRCSRFSGHDVLGVACKNAEAIHVPCFGHDYRCQCETPEAWGVDRYFGVDVVLDGDVTNDMLGTYELSIVVQVCLVGITIPADEFVERRRLDKKD